MLMLFFAIPGKAQVKTDDKPRRFSYYFNGGVGVYVPLSRHGALKEAGSLGSFQFQVDYKEHIFGRVFFDQYNIAYQINFTTRNGSDVQIKGKVPSSLIGLELGYGWHVNRFSPYAFVGTGIDITEVPVLDETPTTNNIKLSSDSQSSIAIRTGLGVNYKISKLFIVYFESQFLSFPVTSQVYSGNLNGVSFQAGFKTPLQ